MKKILLISFLFMMAASFAKDKSNFGFDFDFAQFGYDSTSNYIEFYYSFNQNELTINRNDTSAYVQGDLKISITDTASGKLLVDKDWKVVNELKDTSDVDRGLVGVLGFVILKGTYKINIVGGDAVNTEQSKSITDYLNVTPLWKEKAALSDLQFATRIIPNSPNKKSIFYKNTYEIVPSIMNVYGENQPVLFYYIELYNLKTLPEGNIKLESVVYNSRGKIVSNKSKLISNSVNSRVEVGTVVLNKFPTDSYTLTEALLDSAANIGISSSKRFYVYNPSIPLPDSDYAGNTSSLASEFSVMPEEEIDKIFNESKYVATSNEIKQYEGLKTLEGKRKFIYEFWKTRDTKPETALNEAYLDYMNRVQRCNERFSYMGREGWKSDRGRVYLVYGEPSEIERFPNEQNTKPYEIWHYNEIQGGVIFVFADLTGFSRYTLVHSSMRGEVSDQNWMARVASH
ncbi:MAG: GWxTD domain-containing protein [Ignavibacteriaceae bacterium]